MQVQHVGFDHHGREVFSAFVPDLAGLKRIQVPGGPCLVFIGADTRDAVPEPLYGIARHLLAQGAIFIMCWRPGCESAENLVDEAVVGCPPEAAYRGVMTTHHDESLSDALEFAAFSAIPDPAISPGTPTLLVAFAGNIHWYNEARDCLEKLLESTRAAG